MPTALTTDLIVRTAASWRAICETRFGIATPRLALAGLNPHAGEGGALGREDDAIIAPAVAALARARASTPSGRLPADTMFHARARGELRRGALPCITTRR